MITARAPGKLMLAGEYAVALSKAPALAVAVDRHATTGGGGITLDFGDGDSLWLDGVTSFGALAGSIEFL